MATIDPGPGRLYSVVTSENYVGWVGATQVSAGPEGEPNQVMVHDLTTKKTRVVARSRFPRGTIPRMRAHKDSVVYVDLDGVASDADPRTKWHMYEVSLSTGKERRLASSASPAEEEDPPRPSIAWPWVAWFQATGDDEGHVSVRSFDLRNGEHRTLVPATFGGQLSMDDHSATVYYDDDNGSGGRDVFAVQADGSGSPRRVTTSGLADFPIARNGGVVWQQPPNADSDSLWYKAVDADKEQRFAKSSGRTPAGTNSFPGRGFVVWSGPQGLMAAEPSGMTQLVLQARTELSIAARWWVEGDRVAWATVQGYGDEENSTVHVAVVRE